MYDAEYGNQTSGKLQSPHYRFFVSYGEKSHIQ